MVTVWPDKLYRQRHFSICHQRFLIATVLSWSTTRSVWIVKIQSKSRRAHLRNAVPG